MNIEGISLYAADEVLATQTKKVSISVVGLGYVGAVSTACLAVLGHRVVGVDIDPEKVADIRSGRSPIHEKSLGKFLMEGVTKEFITASTDLINAVRDTDVTFVSVGTPTAKDGGCDDRYIRQAARNMAKGLAQKDDFHVFVMRCSIPPGTTLNVMAEIIEKSSGKKMGRDFGVCFNPEFLREGVAIEDFFNPPKTVIGAIDEKTANIVKSIYAPIDPSPIITTIDAAEMVKYVDNVWHAAKVCFANEIGRLCKPIGVDSHEVMGIFTQDTKLNLSPYYLKPGFAYGGSCLPKEVRAVAHMARDSGVSVPMISNLDVSNQAQINEAVRLVRETGAKRVGILGIAFKPGTDDLRESPALELMARLRAEGIEPIAHDPAVNDDTRIADQLAYVRHGNPGLQTLAEDLPTLLREDLNDVLNASDALVVCHATSTYRQIVRRCHVPVVDLVRLFDATPADVAVQGIGW